jgi:hypothetical protein
MITWKSTFNLENLKDATEVLSIPPSQLEFIEVAFVGLNELFVMWSKKTVLEKEKMEFGWGSSLSIEDISKTLTQTYHRGYISTIDDIDPIIVIDGAVYDGWGRCSIAHALGEKVVKAAIFKRKENLKEHIYLTDSTNFDLAKDSLRNSQVPYEEENFNQGLILHFSSKGDKQKAISLLEKVIDSNNEGLWKC